MNGLHLFVPRAAGEITVGAKLVSYTPRGDGPELTLLEVLKVDAPERIPGAHHHPEAPVKVTLRSPYGGDPFILALKAGTQITVTGIVP